MIQDAVYFIAACIAIGIVWMLCDIAAQYLYERHMRRNRERYWRQMEEKIEFWQKYDREFTTKQKRIRGEQ